MTTFSELGVSKKLIQGLADLKIKTPTEVQVKAIPFLLEVGTDLVAQAQTGTGKTAAFGLPILQKINTKSPYIQSLILCPTRELCQQIGKALFKFTKYSDKIFCESLYGGAPINEQIRALKRPTQIVVATPGRLVDLMKQNAIDLSHIKTVVLDEADEMLSMGFKKELDYVLEATHGQRNTWLFSATMPVEIQEIVKTSMSKEIFRVQIDKNEINKNIEHAYVVCEIEDKLQVLYNFLMSKGRERGVVFCRTKAGAQTLAKQLIAKKFNTEAIHGDLQQRDRDKVMRAFKNEKLQLLIATDVAARGIDVEGLTYVVHYQLPEQLEYYTHRSGRTARAGKKGLSLAFITDREEKRLRFIETKLAIKFVQIRK